MSDPIDVGSSFSRRLADLKTATRSSREAVGRSHALIERLRRGNGGAGPAVSTASAMKTFGDFLASDGPRAALAYLVSLSDYRYLSIFVFKDGIARSAVHIDRNDPTVTSATEVPETATYCRFVRERNGAFAIEEARLDARTEGHPARDTMQAYCGIPILTPEGETLGVLCHYDEETRDPTQLDLELLIQVASALAYSGKVPPFPADDPAAAGA